MFAGKNAFIKLQPFVLCSRPNLRRVSRSLYTMSLKKESMILCHFAKKEQPVHLLQTGIPMSQLFYFHTAHAVPPLDAARTFFPMRQTGRQPSKRASVDGIASCKIRSIILPLLADHVFREANHYLRLLES